jgi:hypothetical protein
VYNGGLSGYQFLRLGHRAWRKRHCLRHMAEGNLCRLTMAVEVNRHCLEIWISIVMELTIRTHATFSAWGRRGEIWRRPEYSSPKITSALIRIGPIRSEHLPETRASISWPTTYVLLLDKWANCLIVSQFCLSRLLFSINRFRPKCPLSSISAY